MFEKLKNIFKRDDVIQSAEDLQKVFNEAGMPNIKIYTVEQEPEIKIYDPLEKIKIELDCKRSAKK